MSRSINRTVAIAATVVLLSSACTGTSGLAGDDGVDRGAATSADNSSLVTLPAVTETTERAPETTTPTTDTTAVALIDRDGQLGIVSDGVVDDRWVKFTAFPSPDRSAAVLTLGPHIEGIGSRRPVVWASLPDGEQLAEQRMRTDSELTATSLDGTFAGFTTRARETEPGAIAGARTTSEIEIISRDEGTVFRQELEGNFVPEAFSRTTNVEGVPTLVFLLEYFPAEAPRFYRVRVLSTETGEVSLPLNLRNKLEQVDEQMAGFSRSQVVAEDHGLLFTLYRGTIDGTPDGEPYAFVHTLDFADGVWCLDVDPRLELDRVPGSLAVGGDRLYVGSANGMIGSYPIPSITDPELSASMDWVATFSGAGERAPAMAADGDGVWVGPDDPASRLIRITADGDRGDPLGLPSSRATAITIDAAGAVHAAGQDWGQRWSTFEVTSTPDWLDDIVHLVID